MVELGGRWRCVQAVGGGRGGCVMRLGTADALADDGAGWQDRCAGVPGMGCACTSSSGAAAKNGSMRATAAAAASRHHAGACNILNP